MFEVYRTQELKRYSEKITSRAFFLEAFVEFIIISLPLGIAYGSGGLFVESNVIRGHLPMNIFRQVRGWILTDKGEFPFSVIVNKEPRCPDVLPAFLSSSLEYASENNPMGFLSADISVPRPEAGRIQGIIVLLPFTFEIPKLDSPLLFSTKLLTFPTNDYMNHVIFNGVLKVNPSIVLSPKDLWKYHEPSKGRYCEISQSLLNRTTEALSLIEITTEFLSNPSIDGILVNVNLNLPENFVSIQSSFWYTIKFAWVQYLCLALLIFYAIEEFRSFCFSRQLVYTTVSSTLDCSCKKKVL